MQSRSILARLTPLFAVMTLPAGILAAIYLGLSTALAVFVVGWLLLTPASAILFGAPTPPAPPGQTQMWDDEEVDKLVQERMKEEMEEAIGESDGRSSVDPVEELRNRYARGEIDELELERRLDALLETEDVDPENEEAVKRAVDNLDTSESNRQPAERDGTDADSDLVSERE
jgi:hypothetical protein